MSIKPEELEICLQVLQQVADDPAQMDQHERFKALVAKVHRHGKKNKRKTLHRKRVEHDADLAQGCGVVQQQSGLNALPAPQSQSRPTYRNARYCYVCKTKFDEVHFFYHLLCPECAKLNWEKRHQRATLTGRIALLTGGRIKIGYQTALKLLRDGAQVHLTTRFPQDAVQRFNKEDDHHEWHERLHVHGLDLRDLVEVEAFALRLQQQLPHLDLLIHNAAQTVKRPLEFYQHLLEDERTGTLALNGTKSILLEARDGYQQSILSEEAHFPLAVLDLDGQQVDLRETNSWKLKLGEISTLEVLEVHLVNSIAPFVLSNHLLPAMLRSPHPRRFIVHVSAMEGQFARESKTEFHPHTNMAKAALNMLTRTSAAELAQRGIYVNSVDTGWITDEKPFCEAEHVREEHGFYTPLDHIDGAARIYDPIATGINESDEPLSGHFLKDYFPYPW